MSSELLKQVEAAPWVDLGPLLERVTRLNDAHQYGLNDVRGVTNTKEIAGTKANVSDRALETFFLKTVESTLSQIRRRRARGTSGLWPSSP